MKIIINSNVEGGEEMTMIHDLKEIIVDGLVIRYFYKRERNDYYGNPQYRVYIFNPNEQSVIERIANTYEMTEWIRSFIKKSSLI